MRRSVVCLARRGSVPLGGAARMARGAGSVRVTGPSGANSLRGADTVWSASRQGLCALQGVADS
jgi:hypothetical protein